MPFLQMKKIKSMVKFFGIFLALLIIAGCVAQNSEKAHTSEQSQIGMSEQATGTNAADIVRQISTVAVNQQNQNIDILIHGNQKLVYTSIKQSFPFGIAVYLPETVKAPDFKTIVPDNKSISDLIVSYADNEKTTIKIEILLNQDFDYEVIESDSTLKVTLSGNMDKTPELSKSAPLPDNEATIQKIIAQEEVIIPDKTAIMTNIEFATLEDGKSDIVIQTNQPVKYDITQENNNKIYLNLYNTIIPDYHKRPIITEYFKSAVQRLMPEQVPGNKKNARIEINMREQVPYRIVRGENNILMFFEPSNIEPPEFTKAKKKVVSGTTLQDSETSVNEVKKTEDVQAVTIKKKTLEEEILGPKKKFTGEKIKLDFYETDIKNVFRILRSVGGLNFAIDKDVEGKVTLALENPLPWDQVLDLVLKMNSLGMKEEGNVIRIATLDTIKKEDKLLEETINARKKSIEQKESFEPLITEYIPINYSDAESEVKPHIEQILSKERGKISVDKRSNMIIITDTQAKIDQAKEIIFRLDQVTPQIMIEAKVVEVTKNFTRELGLGLSFTKSQTANTGRDRDFTVALNSPIAAPVNTGAFNFYNILGSQFLSLNAQIAASEVKGDVKVVSSPRILTLDNKLAKIKQGLEYAYLERDDTGGSSVKFKNIDLLLEVTPHVTPDKRVAMVIHLTKNDLSSVTNGVPSLSTNEATTELLVNNNDTIVIGGVIKTTDNTSTTGTPFLSGIPVLGRLFRTDTDTNNRNELLIFITPSIIQLDQKKNNFTSNKQ
ncbi:type IV pilus secretin PilQ [Desulfobacterales bacterium HSG17]|nr:type IV pilus secretin PilQ [Desulfobacterales bacterium HSG17]